MVDEEGLKSYLKKKRKSANTIDRSLMFTIRFANFLVQFRKGASIEDSEPADLEEFVAWLEENNESPNAVLWGLWFYFDFIERKEMTKRVSELRGSRIKTPAFLLSDFRDVSQEYADKLGKIGIKNVSEMLDAGRTRKGRQEIAERSGVPLKVVEELALLSDLSRIPGLKAIRARLYYDAGVETLDKLAKWDPEELRTMLVRFVAESGFDGMVPWPKEAKCAVETARELPRLLEY
ncbi:MAG: DUF4332 domain-containing protein [Candidatus Thorarchaeota archaeon]|nr:MAG: DUF4332 domain-containing protein [Candidatus Thorarchaeota archaeon]